MSERTVGEKRGLGNVQCRPENIDIGKRRAYRRGDADPRVGASCWVQAATAKPTAKWEIGVGMRPA